MKYLYYTFLGISIILIIFVFMTLEPDIAIEQLLPKYTNEFSSFVQVDGINVHYRDEGNGAPLLLLHGSGASLHTWHGWTAALKDSFRVIRIDVPGFGLTGAHPARDYSMPSYSKFLAAFLDALDIESVLVAGNSLGGRISWEFALAYPERVKKIILIDAQGFPTPKKPLGFKLAQNRVTRILVRHLGVRSLVENSLREVYFDKGKISAELIDRYYELLLRRGNRQANIDRVNTTFANTLGQLKDIQQPVLIMWGEKDIWEPLENAYRYKEALSHSQIITYQNAGHIPMEELPEDTAADARKFLMK